MKFLKVHGLGNDFVLVDTREVKSLPVDPEALRDLAVKICDRNFGIGADGLVLIKDADGADASMQIINSDGSEAEMCGNAIRCVARYVYEKGQVKDRFLRIKTMAGIIIPEIILQHDQVAAVRVDMGEPTLERAEIPMIGAPGSVVGESLQWEDKNFVVTAVSMGNPHCIIVVPDIEAVPLSVWGPGIENLPVFPRKTNVEFVQVLNQGEINMRVWERGAGPTLACGTGASAAVVACVLNGLTGRKVTVNLVAGSLEIEWKEENNRVYMTGPTQFVFEGEYLVK